MTLKPENEKRGTIGREDATMHQRAIDDSYRNRITASLHKPPPLTPAHTGVDSRARPRARPSLRSFQGEERKGFDTSRRQEETRRDEKTHNPPPLGLQTGQEQTHDCRPDLMLKPHTRLHVLLTLQTAKGPNAKP